MKRNSLIVVVVLGLLILFGGGLFLIVKSKNKSSASGKGTPTPTISLATKMIDELPIEERPYVSLTPSSDGHWVTLDAEKIPDSVTEVEYEIIYTKSTDDGQRLEEGLIGHGSTENGSYTSGKRLFGTESSGHYRFDKEVQGEQMILRFRTDKEVLKFESEWSLFQGGSELSTTDNNFSLKGNFSKSNFYLVLKTGGLPKAFSGEIAAGPYGVFTDGSTAVKNIQLTMTIPEGKTNAKLYSLIGSSWTEIKNTNIEGVKISGTVNNLGIFIAASPSSE